MSLGKIRYIEPMDEGDDDVGFLIVCDNHDMVYIPCSQWTMPETCSVELNENERDMMVRLAEEHTWPLPRRADIETHRSILLSYKAGGAIGGDLRENADQVRQKVLIGLSSRISRCLQKVVDLSDPRDYTILSEFVILSYFRYQFRNCPLVRIEGITGSGKSTLLELLGLLCYRGCVMSDTSAPALMEEVERHGVTVLLDETADMLKDPSYRAGLIRVVKAAFSNGTRARMSLKSDEIKIRHMRTAMAFTNKDANLPEDIVNRSVEVVMVNSNRRDLYSLSHLDWVDWEFPEDSPEAIRDDLYALKALTAFAECRGECTDIGAEGIFLNIMERQAYRNLTPDEKTGQYLWAFTTGLDPAEITGRNLDIAMVFYTVALSIDLDAQRDVMSKIVDNMEMVSERLQNITAAVLANAYLNVVYSMSEPFVGEFGTVRLCDVVAVSRKITTHDINEEYACLRARDGFFSTEDPRTLTTAFKNMKFKTRSGSGRLSFVVADDPEFENALFHALSLADYDNRRRFAGVREELVGRSRPKGSRRPVKDGGSRWATAPTGASPTASTSSCITSARPSPDPPPTTGAGSWR